MNGLAGKHTKYWAMRECHAVGNALNNVCTRSCANASIFWAFSPRGGSRGRKPSSKLAFLSDPRPHLVGPLVVFRDQLCIWIITFMQLSEVANARGGKRGAGGHYRLCVKLEYTGNLGSMWHCTIVRIEGHTDIRYTVYIGSVEGQVCIYTEGLQRNWVRSEGDSIHIL